MPVGTSDLVREAPRRRSSAFVGLLAACVVMAAPGVVVAEDARVPFGSSSSSDEAKATLYTNADLDRLEPLAVDDGPAVVESADDWYFVLLMLDRERERIEADRFDRRERDRLETAERISERRDRRGAYAPYGVGFGGIVFAPGGSSVPDGSNPPHERTAGEIERDRVRVPFDQRGIRTAGDHFREGLEASQKRFAEALPPTD